MNSEKFNDMLGMPMEGIQRIAELDSVIGTAIETSSGVTVIPISKISAGFANGGLDYGSKKIGSSSSFGGGGGSGVSITPIAFLTVDKACNVNLVHVSSQTSDIERLTSLIEKSPEIIKQIKDILS